MMQEPDNNKRDPPLPPFEHPMLSSGVLDDQFEFALA
jgi:hypothetical protein